MTLHFTTMETCIQFSKKKIKIRVVSFAETNSFEFF